MNTFAIVLFWLLLADAVMANVLAWGRSGWYASHFRTFSRYFPMSRGWVVWYLVLVLWIGYLTFLG